MSVLPTALRGQLGRAAFGARKIAESGARKALEALAVHEPDPYRHMNEAQRTLRRKLRAQAKQLGDGESQTRRGAYEIKHLVEKIAYDQWHRLLFARFLLENNLLISPEHQVSVTLDDCEELAPSLGLKDAWAVAARFAAKELPEIFRSDDPAGAVELPVEDRNPLVQLVTDLPVGVFTASDSLGWCYQFWQAERKDEVNAAGNKIGADELPAVTQLFTEDYMVDFLLDNTLGAWHAGKVLAANAKLAEAQSEDELRQAVALPGCAWSYLRFIKDKDGKWTPAASTFDGWPKTARQLRCLDPCMGSGHFVVAMFQRLVALRMAEEGLDESSAVGAVIGDNLFGLELDARCTQIGAFNLALAAWRRVGHCKLPAMNLACSGLAPNAKKEDWLKLAGDSDRLERGMTRLYAMFKDAPELGSLINPRATGGDSLEAELHELQPLLEKALAREVKDDATHEMTVTARGLARAAEILAAQFTLVVTNVPYLGRSKQNDILGHYIDRNYREGNADLATAFLLRLLLLCSHDGGSTALVTPQNWLFLATYKELRAKLLKDATWNMVARLGTNAFQDMNWWAATTALSILSQTKPESRDRLVLLDVSADKQQAAKAAMLRGELPCETTVLVQANQLTNPDHVISSVEFSKSDVTLGELCFGSEGSKPGQTKRVVLRFWELRFPSDIWTFLSSSPSGAEPWSGNSDVTWNPELTQWKEIPESGVRPLKVWGNRGVILQKVGRLPCGLYGGNVFDNNCFAFVPRGKANLPALWCFFSSDTFAKVARAINQKSDISLGAVLSIPLNLNHWKKIAEHKYPHGLPKPFSSDPTQWLFNGHPAGADQPLHVAVARLLGYQWPRQSGSSFPDCPALDPDGLENLASDDGIVSISPLKGEGPAAERLRELLAHAYGKDWNASRQEALLARVDCAGASLEDWLRNGFFEQHCTLFHHRPFIWHIWDGFKNGFSVLVNYHKLTHANLEKLTYSYLGDWIRRQQAAVEAEEAGSDARLQAAKQLQGRLKLILEGEPPYDLFVRWKPLSKQAIGWQPDINDGVRLNIRPFATADVLRKRVKISWGPKADRGKEPKRDKAEYPWFWNWDEERQDFAGIGKEPDGNRWNDCHYTNAFKKTAREASKKR